MSAETRPAVGDEPSAVPRRSRRLLLGLCGLLVAVGLVAGGTRLAQHDDGWAWSMSPSATPSRIHFEGRDYDRGGEQPDGVPSGYVLEGETPGGGKIYKSGLSRGTSTVILVKDGQYVYAYGLVGGP
jgi:hypothetical protein